MDPNASLVFPIYGDKTDASGWTIGLILVNFATSFLEDTQIFVTLYSPFLFDLPYQQDNAKIFRKIYQHQLDDTIDLCRCWWFPDGFNDSGKSLTAL